jgi:hypothetical protein
MARNLISILVAALILVIVPRSGLGHPDDYSPFTRKPRQFPLKHLVVLNRGERDSFVTFGLTKGGVAIPLLKLAEGARQTTADLNELYVYDQTGKPTKRLVFPNDCFLSIADAYVGDLNRDSKNDFVVTIKTAATGLGDHEYDVLFALSSKSGYKVSALKSWDVVAKDFVDIEKNGHSQFILVSLIYPNYELGIKHSYWAYDLLEAHGTGLRPANYLDRKFPIWVLYTNNPNHKGSLPVSRLVARKLLESRLNGARG